MLPREGFRGIPVTVLPVTVLPVMQIRNVCDAKRA